MILSPIFFFIFYNPIIGVFQQKLLQYFTLSMIAFFSLVTYIYISGNFVSGSSFMQLEELHWMTKAVAIFYFMLNLICLLFRGIIYMLEQLDE
ncbi:MAG: hypothetical protein JWN78_669 [Bacteroidota bacterium]|nr:hypothetical protein [Bacteroidota bacterium]